MANTKNETNLGLIKENLASAKSVVLANYEGLGVNEVNELRAKLDEAGASAKVYKNTLVRIAVKEELGTELDKTDTQGPTLVITSNEDPIAAVKALYEYIKEFSLPTVKLGFLGKEYLDETRVQALSALPSKAELMAKVVWTLKNPTTRFTRTIANPSSKFV